MYDEQKDGIRCSWRSLVCTGVGTVGIVVIKVVLLDQVFVHELLVGSWRKGNDSLLDSVDFCHGFVLLKQCVSCIKYFILPYD